MCNKGEYNVSVMTKAVKDHKVLSFIYRLVQYGDPGSQYHAQPNSYI